MGAGKASQPGRRIDMGKKIIIELEGDEHVLNEIIRSIETEAVSEIGTHKLESYSIRKETFPGKNSCTAIKMPMFMKERRVISRQEKGLMEAIYGKGGTQDG